MVRAVPQLSPMCVEYNIVLEPSFVGIRGSEAINAAARNGVPQGIVTPGILNWNFRTAVGLLIFAKYGSWKNCVM
jgi:hypothetical protein